YLALAYEKMGDQEACLANYQRAIELKPDQADFHYSLAKFYLTIGDGENAVKHFTEAERLSPQSSVGVLAAKEKQRLETKLMDRKIVEEWLKKEVEEKEQKKQKAETGEETPGEMPGETKEGTAIGEEEKREPAEKLVKVLRHGRQRQRKEASEKLLGYPAEETAPFLRIFISLFRRERISEIRENIIVLIGQTRTSEGAETLLSILKDPQESFRYKLVALKSLGESREEKVVLTLRSTLNSLVDARIKQREEAKKNLSQVERQLEEIEVQRITLEAEKNTLEQKRNQLQERLSMVGFEPGQAPGLPEAGRPQAALKPAEIVRIQQEVKSLDQNLQGKQKEIEALQEKKQELEMKKARFLSLLSARQPGLEGTREQVREFPEMMPGIPGQIEETPEEKNEQQFALTLIDALGLLRDKESLPVIRRAWREYGRDDDRLKSAYYLAEARLGDYSNLSELIEKLRQDLPEGEGNMNEEVSLRAGIIQVTGEYVKNHPDDELMELLDYLAEEANYPEIKEAAEQAIELVKGEPKHKKTVNKTQVQGRKTPAKETPRPEFGGPPPPPPR
ncbi:MAG: tetratricopeptide repeat protein, partial [Candidatus Omnitrophica bacterium]|nr:tetratricopeptide repeat protein [Candidatus Omnitrophota bacterium]